MARRNLATLFLACCCVFLLPGCAAESGGRSADGWRNVIIESQTHRLFADAKESEDFKSDIIDFRGGIHLTADFDEFGGYSGLEISPGGEALLAISDRAHWLAATLNYNDDDVLVGLSNARIAPLKDARDRPLRGKSGDAESIFGEGSELLVSFERNHRIDAYRPTPTGDIEFSRAIADLSTEHIPENKGVESLIRIATGELLAITEGAATDKGAVKAWLIAANGDRQALSYKSDPDFGPTDLALLPNSDVLMLERAYSNESGTRIRLTKIPSGDIKPGARLAGEELLRLSAPAMVDNFEGLAVRQSKGETLIYLISDDNQNSARQKTLLLVFEYNG